MSQSALTKESEILGYRLIERIGAGGFGEVWSAIAPGGLKKAVKVVYGYHDGHRAQAELKALDRVKELRHPFLLSLERIEIHNGQLVVISELADCCLADMFNQYIANGEPGIPRDELLGYLKCASEALDYLSDEHGLQHLDIKPENLLIVGTHIKVADFGLIKDLQHVSQSLMSGMTPAYAAPELFDGRPGSNSDQYSLAILYQEMLTGVRPFPGTTPAQLAAQHMHGKPNLTPLPHSDQAIVAKALAKDPLVRFRNCREFVEELTVQRRVKKKAVLRRQTQRESPQTDSNTIGLPHGHDVTAVITDRGLPFVGDKMEVLPGVELETATFSPTFLIGLGETGNRIVQSVKSLLVARHQCTSNLPAIKMLAIDSDRNSLSKLWRSTGDAALTSSEILEVPLRKPEDYRKRIQKHLAWLSRRWIYNVPRSLQTEGLRPLGRLVFADHFDSICDRIQDQIREMVTEENLAKTADTLNMDPGGLNPRILIVASASGGIGSGMSLDLAYTARLLSHECGVPADSVTGFMLHSTYQRYRDPGLSAANAFALLTELRHYVEQGYPGDQTLGMPDFEDHPPFDATYFDELGHDLCQSVFGQKIDSIAEYLTMSTTTKSSAFFKGCRQLEEEQEHFSLRTFGISVDGLNQQGLGSSTIQQIGKGLIRKWLTCAKAESNGETQPKVDLVEADLTEAQVDQAAAAIFQQDRPEINPESVRSRCLEVINANPNSIAESITQLADQVFGKYAEDRDSSYSAPEHCHRILDEAGIAGQNHGEQLRQQILKLLEGSQFQLGEAKAQCRKIIQKVQELASEFESHSSTAKTNFKALISKLSLIPVASIATNEGIQTQVQELFSALVQQRHLELVLRAKQNYLRILGNSIVELDEVLGRFVNQVAMIDSDLDGMSLLVGSPESNESLNINLLIQDQLNLNCTEHVQATERLVFDWLIEPNGGYFKVLEDPSLWQGKLVSCIKTASQVVINEHQRSISLKTILEEQNINSAELIEWFQQQIKSAQPEIHDCGGSKRLLMTLPELTDDVEMFKLMLEEMNLEGTLIPSTLGNFVLCYEGENVSLPSVAYRLLRSRPDAVELVKRIHSRNDISWVSLDDLL